MILKTPDEWLETKYFKGYIIYDPDGWDRKNFDEDWAKPISKKEMDCKLMQCTLGGVPKRISDLYKINERTIL